MKKKRKDQSTLEARIRANYEDMPPAERRLADLLIGFPGNIATYSATELADLAGTSKAAASRLFQRLGYTSFNEARHEARGARQWGSPLYLDSRGGSPSQHTKPLAAHITQEAENLGRTLEALRPDMLREATGAIAAAKRVFIIGFRNSRMLAFYLQRQFQLLRPDTALLPGAGQTLGEDLVDLGPDDVLIVIGMRRRVQTVHTVLEAAHRAGCPALLITDPSATRTPRLATWTIRCEVRATSIFDSYTGAFSVLNLLAASLYAHVGAAATERLRKIESLHEDLAELDQTAWFSGMLDEA